MIIIIIDLSILILLEYNSIFIHIYIYTQSNYHILKFIKKIIKKN